MAIKTRIPPLETTWLPLHTVCAFEALAEQMGVSTVARGPDGFLEQYDAVNGNPEALQTVWYSRNQSWWQRRNGFVRRHLAQMLKQQEAWWMNNGHPTRRHLALIMWAYSPDPASVERAMR